MLHLLDESLEAYLRSVVPLPTRDVDIAFEAPDSEWAAGLSSRPTVNLYLWDVRPNLAQRQYGDELTSLEDGQRVWRHPLPRVDCRYLVTAWTTEVRDEHSLLGAVMTAFLVNPVIKPDFLQGALADIVPQPSVHLRTGDGTENSDFWSALGGQLKPGLDVVVTATVDATLLTPAEPAVEKVVTNARRRPAGVTKPAAK